MLKRADKPAIIKTTLTVVGQGLSQKMAVDYHNNTPEEVNAFIEQKHEFVDFFNFMVAGIPGSDYQTTGEDGKTRFTAEALAEMENTWPGLTDCIMAGFSIARRVNIAKN